MAEARVRCSHTRMVPIGELVPHPKNRNVHPADQIPPLANAIEYQGWRRPIVVSNLSGFITSGHGRLLAAKHKKWSLVPVDYQDYDDETQEYIDVQADNASAAWAGLDFSAINSDLAEMGPFDIDLLCIKDFTVEALDRLNNDPDESPEPPKIAKTKRGELWLLGNHRLLIDDCTDKSNVEMLMGGAKADVVFTDPPYGMNLDTEYSSSWGKQSNTSGNIGPRTTKNHAPVIGDDQDFDPAHIFETFYGTKDVLLFGADYFCQKIPTGGSWIVWDKTGGNESLDNTGFQSRFELCWSKAPHRRKIYRSTWIGVAGMHHKDDSNRMHPTQKPVKLCEQILNDLDGITVADPYLGSGSTLIACEKTGRRCYGMEIAPLYADVIIERWEKFTGKQATREDGIKFNELA